MGDRSVVFGHIHTRGNAFDAPNRQALQRFPFDDVYPFRDIFHLEASPQYKAPSILFGGTFKALEQDWPEWFTRFTQLLSSLEAIEANVILDCILGRFAWTLAPEPLLGSLSVPEDDVPLMGHPWWIIQAPELPEDVRTLLHPAQIPVRITAEHVYGY